MRMTGRMSAGLNIVSPPREDVVFMAPLSGLNGLRPGRL